jgi:hypothetical protein
MPGRKAYAGGTRCAEVWGTAGLAKKNGPASTPMLKPARPHPLGNLITIRAVGPVV